MATGAPPGFDTDTYNNWRDFQRATQGQYGADRGRAFAGLDSEVLDAGRTANDKLLAQLRGTAGFEGTEQLTWAGDKLRAVAGDGADRMKRSVLPGEDGKLGGSQWISDPETSVLQDVAPYAGLALNFIPGVGPLASAAISGGLTKLSGGSWGDALKSGALSYAGGQLGRGITAGVDSAVRPLFNGLDTRLADAAVRGVSSVGRGAVNDLLRGRDIDIDRLLSGGLRSAVGPVGSWAGGVPGIGSSLDAGGGNDIEEGSFAPGGNYADDGRAQAMDFDSDFGDQPGDYDMPTTPDPTGNWWEGSGGWGGGLGGTSGDQPGDYDMPTTPDPTGNWWEGAGGSGGAGGGALNKLWDVVKNFGSGVVSGDPNSVRQMNMLLGLLGMAGSFGNRGGGQGALSVADARNMVAGPGDKFSPAAQANMDKYFSSPLTKYKRPSPTQFGVNPFAPKYAEGGEVMPEEEMMTEEGGLPMGFLNQVASEVGPVQGEGGGQDDLVEAALSPGEYVFDADVVSALGDGSNEEGARKLDAMRERIRAHKRSAPVSEIPPRAKSPLAYLQERGL